MNNYIDPSFLKDVDPALYCALNSELQRQQETIELIASENIVSPAVLAAQGSILTNKYAEGYPNKRYYGGCEKVDAVEVLAIERLQQLFHADHANVQPHSGSQANMGAYMALLKPGDRVLGMDLNAGGHLTHGYKLNFSGSIYESYSYNVDPTTFLIDYSALREQAKEIRPKVIVAGASAYSRTVRFDLFKEIADEVGAYLIADMAHIAGLVAAGLHPSPVPYADIVTSTTHKTLRGPRGGIILCKKEHAAAVDKAIFPGIQGGPLMHVILAKAIAFGEALKPEFKTYQQQVIDNAAFFAKELINKGYPIVSGGTDNHLFLVDLRPFGLSGKQLEVALDSVNITLNKNGIPYDTAPPLKPSGVRIGTPAITSRGFKEKECALIADFFDRVIRSKTDKSIMDVVKNEVLELCTAFPIYKS
ncbi:MAG: serine hydroxymethyltransferase [Brevinema sp.]